MTNLRSIIDLEKQHENGDSPHENKTKWPFYKKLFQQVDEYILNDECGVNCYFEQFSN
jgi:hypothetical protein